MTTIRSISKVIYKSMNFTLSALVLLNPEVNPKTQFIKRPFKTWTDNAKDQISVTNDFIPFIVFDFNHIGTASYNSSNRLMIPATQCWKLSILLETMIINIQNHGDEIFICDEYSDPNDDSKNYALTVDGQQKYHIYDRKFMGQKEIHLFPSLIPNGYGGYSRAVQITVNGNDIGTIMNLDDVKTLIYIFDKLDWFSLSESLIVNSALISGSDRYAVTRTSSTAYRQIQDISNIEDTDELNHSKPAQMGNTSVFKGLKGSVE